jgi:hypothetical protein
MWKRGFFLIFYFLKIQNELRSTFFWNQNVRVWFSCSWQVIWRLSWSGRDFSEWKLPLIEREYTSNGVKNSFFNSSPQLDKDWTNRSKRGKYRFEIKVKEVINLNQIAQKLAVNIISFTRQKYWVDRWIEN